MFKKTLCFALTLIICCSCSLIAFAEIDSAYFKRFEITVDNPDGIPIFEREWDSETGEMRLIELYIIPENTTITITDEFIYDGVTYLYTSYGSLDTNDYYDYHDCHERFIKASDIHIDNYDIIKPSSKDRIDYNLKIIVINTEGTSLRSGPSLAYPSVVTVPTGTEFDIDYIIGTWGAWAYVTYNGKSGWLHFHQNNISYDCATVKEKTGKVMVVDNSTYLIQTPQASSPKVSEAIPYGTVLSYKYVYQTRLYDYVYVEYNGAKGWVLTSSFGADGTAHHNKNTIVIINPDGEYLYSNAKDSDEILCKVPYNTVITPEYTVFAEWPEEGEFDYYAYVSYNGIKGWIRCYWKDMLFTFSSVKLMDITAKSIPVHKEPRTDSTVIDTLDNFDMVYQYFPVHNDGWVLIYNGEYFGWVKNIKDSWELNREVEKKPFPEYAVAVGEPIPFEEYYFDDEAEAIPAPSLIDAETQPTDNTVAEKTISPMMIAGLCVGAAVIGAVTAAVIIVIVIKKRKK